MYGLIIFTLISFTIGGINTEYVEVVPVDLKSGSNAGYTGTFSRPLQNLDIIQVCGKMQASGNYNYITFKFQSRKHNITENIFDLTLWIDDFAYRNRQNDENTSHVNDFAPYLQKGGYFNLYIMVAGQLLHYDISKGKRIDFYELETPIDYIDTIYVGKDIERVSYIAHQLTSPNINPNCIMPSCNYDPNIPYRTYFPSLIKPGQIISITGTPTGSTRGNFSINFTGNNVKEILFHFNPRFSTKSIALNAQNDDLTWQSTYEEIFKFPFQVNKQFNIVFGLTNKSFKFGVNGEDFGKFDYRQVNILKMLNGFYVISGDGMEVVISSVNYIQSDSPNLENFAAFLNI